MTAAVYHYTDRSHVKPKVNQRMLQKLHEYAHSLGYSDVDIYCDEYIWRTHHSAFDRLMAGIRRYDALILKDFRHFGENTKSCLRQMRNLVESGIPIFTLDDGSFTTTEEPLRKPLRVATYYCGSYSPEEFEKDALLKNDILKLFAEKRSAWTVIDQYADNTSRQQRKGEQTALAELIANRDKYDLVLVHNINDIHWRVSEFTSFRHQLGLDIFSLQDGFLKFERE